MHKNTSIKSHLCIYSTVSFKLYLTRVHIINMSECLTHIQEEEK